MLIEDLLNSGSRVMLMEPFVLPGSATREKYDEFLPDVQSRQVIVRSLAQQYKLPVVYLQQKFDEATELAPEEYWLRDGVHPTAAGHKLIADEWIRVFKQDVLPTF